MRSQKKIIDRLSTICGLIAFVRKISEGEDIRAS